MLDSIQPIVLVGGASSRFGRDKLREPVGDGWLVDRPIAALRGVFGARVVLVGDCHGGVASRADGHLADRYPGMGPLGGIIAAIEATSADVFVLPGDLPMVTGGVIRAILDVAAREVVAWAVLASTDRLQPCVGLYRRAGLVSLRSMMAGRLMDAIPAERRRTVPVDAAAVANANTPEDLRAAQGAGGPSMRR